MTPLQELQAVVRCRVAGLSEPSTAAVLAHLNERPGDAARAVEIAQTVQALAGSAQLLAALLRSDKPAAWVLYEASRLCTPTWRLPVSADRVMRAKAWA